ncbi:MAG: AAA family ATPase, partial [Pseudomonadota bacterium]
MIILLNGTSSVGKSTLAKAILAASNKPFLYHASDHILNFWLDSKFFTLYDNKSHLTLQQQQWYARHRRFDNNGKAMVTLDNGSKAINLYRDLWQAAGVLIAKGYDMVIDEVIISKEQLNWLLEYLQSSKVMLVKVVCQEQECLKRERERGDRYVGLANGLMSQVEKVV